MSPLPDEEAARRLLGTARASLIGGQTVHLPGLGRLGDGRAHGVEWPASSPSALRFTPLATDPELAGVWPASALEPADPFARRWVAFVVTAAPGERWNLTPGWPVRLVEPPAGLFPASVLAVEEEPETLFSLPWLNDLAARVSTAAGTLWVVGADGPARILICGRFEQGRHVSLFAEPIDRLFAGLAVPGPALPALPDRLVEPIAAAVAKLRTPEALAWRLVAAESNGAVDLDAVAGLLVPRVERADPLLLALELALKAATPLGVLATAVRRAFGRLARELALLPTAQACVDLDPLGILVRVDEPELAARLPAGPGRVILPAAPRWGLSWTDCSQ